MAKTTKPATIGLMELSARLADRHDLSKARAKAILDDVGDHIVETVMEG